MFFSSCITTVIEDIQSLTQVQILKPYFYDPDPGNFGTRLHAKLAQMDFLQREEDWLVTIFSRAAQEPLSELSRKNDFLKTDLVKMEGTKYRVKFVSCSVELGFVSNSPDFLEYFEEVLLIRYDRARSIEIPLYPVIEKPVKIYLEGLTPAGLNKLDNDTHGSLEILRWNVDIQYPVIYPVESGKLITDVRFHKEVIKHIRDYIELL